MIVVGQKPMFVKSIAQLERPRLVEDLQMGMGPEADQVDWDQEGVLHPVAE